MNALIEPLQPHLWLLKSSLQAALLVGVVLLIQWLGRRRLSARWRHALWWLVVLRLLIPVVPESGFSLFNWARWGTAPEAISLTHIPLSQPVPSPVGSAPESSLTAAPERLEPMPVPMPTAEFTPSTGSPTVKTTPAVEVAPIPQPTPAPTETRSTWPTILGFVWLAGVILLAGRLGIVAFRLRRVLRQARRLEDEPTLALLEQVRLQMGVRRRLTVWETAAVDGPALCGLLRPRLLLPPGFAAQFETCDLRFVFLHELAHLKRHDIAANWLTTLLQVVHWFNPLVWFAFRRMRADCELACDALALRTAGDGEQRAYGETIIKLLQGVARPAALPGLLGILEDRAQMRHRVRMIARYRPTRRQTGLAMVCGAVLGCICLTDAQSPKPSKPEADATSEATTVLAESEEPAPEIRIGADPVPEDSEAVSASKSLTVKVVATEAGMPIAGAEVHCPQFRQANEPPIRRLTDEEGQFILRFAPTPADVNRGTSGFSLWVDHPGYGGRGVSWTALAGKVLEHLPPEVTVSLKPGVVIGGSVRDEQGNPVPEVKVHLIGRGNPGVSPGRGLLQMLEYPVPTGSNQTGPASVTDADGDWTFADFPEDLGNLELELTRPDGSRTTFSTEQGPFFRNGSLAVSLAALLATNAVLTLPEGLTVHGIVVDENGKPLSDVTVKDGHGFGNIVRTSEAKTDAEGRFKRSHRVPRQWIYTASRADRATVSVIAQVEPGMPEVRLILPPAQPLRLRAVDPTGQPLAGVEFSIDAYRTKAQILDWTATSDADGTAVWENPPTAPATLYATSKSPVAKRKFKITPGVSEQTVVLDSEALNRITVKGNVVDADTGQPVTLRRVGIDLHDDTRSENAAELDAGAFRVGIQRSDFRPGMYPTYRLQIEADGYEPLQTEPIDYDEGDQDLRLSLTPSLGSDRLSILQPDGQAAAGARVWVKTSPNDMGLYSQKPGRYYGDRMGKAEADTEGHVTLPSAPPEAAVVITHSDGFLESTSAALRQQREVRLEPYGVVEGRLEVAGEPKGNAPIVLASLAWLPSQGFHVNYNATTAPDGTFSFTEVPAGEYKLWRWQPSPRQGVGGGTITETWQWPLVVFAGETNHILYAFHGRRVTGQLVAKPGGRAVDWRNDHQALALKPPEHAAAPPPSTEDFATYEAYWAAYEASRGSDARLKQARYERTYQLEVEADGSFRIEDVTPGDYELRIRLSKPGADQPQPPFARPEAEIGSLTREVAVPAGDTPLDLGTIEVPVKSDGSLAEAAPIELAGTTLSGKPIKLADIAGELRVVVFWGAWSDRSREALTELEQLREDLNDLPGLIFVGVNLDDDREATATTVREAGYDWPPIWLDPEQRGQAVAALDLTRLPTVLLLDSAGRIKYRDLPVDRLRPAIERLLRK